MTFDMRHVTCDTQHMSHEAQGVSNILSNSLALALDIWIKGKELT